MNELITAGIVSATFVAIAFVAWRRYLWASETPDETPKCPYSLTEVFGENHLDNCPHQKGVQWLTDVFSRTARTFPNHTALQIPSTGESLTYAELDSKAELIASAISPFLSGPDQVVAVAMPQDNWQIVASHLAILKAGGTLMFIDATLPQALVDHMLKDASPVLVLTRGESAFRDLPTLDVLVLPTADLPRKTPTWLDDPQKRLATIFYTSGTTGMPRGVECHHAGYVNLALTYADYFDLVPGIDATSLTSSLGYDGSISEMYSAWVSGCAVVLLTKDEVRSGPDLVPILNEAEVTVLFCPPVLLSTLTQSPEFDLPYPICRYIVPAGEAFPNALVEPWTRNRRQIINTYGPTEASTDTSRQSLRPGEPITIGSPFPNVTYVILEIDGIEPLEHGNKGELCIGGVHVSRGYRNLPEQTEKKFIDHPRFGRLYRTGDEARIDAKTHRVDFLGRIDSQLKVRGHRVEAQAVEDILQTQFQEIDSAVLDYQNEALVAFVSAPSMGRPGFQVTPAPIEWAERVTASLAEQLPRPSVPDRIFLVEKFVMKSVSGKIDRKSLPDLSHLLKATQPSFGLGSAIKEQPVNGPDLSGKLGEVLRICRSVLDTPLEVDDEFAYSGGHSIAIARLAQQLQAAGFEVSVRGLLSDRNTVSKIVAGLSTVEAIYEPALNQEAAAETVDRDEAAAEVLSVPKFTALQILFAAFLYSPGLIAIVALAGEAEDGLFIIAASLWEFVLAGLLLYLAILTFPFAALIWVLVLKSFLGASFQGDIRPGAYPKWSRMHLRIWCIGRLDAMVLVPMATLYRSAPLRAFVLRQLGADVGKNLQCAQDALISGPLRLLKIGDNVAIQTGVYIQTIRWVGQFLELGSVHLGDGCKVGMRAAVGSGVSVGSGTWVTPFTPVLKTVGKDEVWSGAPARLTGRYTELRRTADTCRQNHSVWLTESLNLGLQVALTILLSALPIAAILWVVSNYVLAAEPALQMGSVGAQGAVRLIWDLLLYGVITTWVTIVVTSLLNCIFIRFTASSSRLYATSGLKGALLMYRMNRMNSVQRQWTWTITGQYLRALAGVRFSRVGGSECDVMFNLVPETCSADSQVFWSNGCFTNMLDYGARHIVLRRLDMPQNLYTGNNSVSEYGKYPPNFLLGVSTPASDIQFRRQMQRADSEQITIAGNPPVRFGHATVPAENEYPPSFPLFLTRVFLNDVFSIGIIPVTEGLIFAIAFICFSVFIESPIIAAIGALAISQAMLILVCIAVKKMLVGKCWGVNDKTPFWSLRHFTYFFAQDCFFVWCRESLRFLGGTVIANSILRGLGCRIGERTIVAEPLQCSDWNAVSVGDDCYVDGYLQLHTFEDRILKVKRMHVEDGAAVNGGATLMGGARLDRGTTVFPLSLILKDMHLPGGVYEGSPADRTITPPGTPRAVTEHSTVRSYIVDNTDILKAAAIIFVLIDHTGYFLMENDNWWGAFGRLAAPTFFFLMGYAQTRRVPTEWILLGAILTLLESSNNNWTWVAPNILFSFALIRLAHPYAERLVERFGWIAYLLLAVPLIAVLPVAGKAMDYGSEGWLWALFGLSQRMFLEKRTRDSASPSFATIFTRSVICIVVGFVYIWQEQREFGFSHGQLAVVIIGVAAMSLSFFLFSRGPSRKQPPAVIGRALCFIGRNTLAIYAIELLAFELIVKILPDLKP